MQRLLIVDDDEEIRSLLQKFFQRSGFETDTAASGADMDTRLSRARYDLVILDVMLPDEDGFSLCKRLHAAGGTAIIMVTGVVEPTDRIVGLELGADDYVTKPFDARELLARVRAVLRRSESSAASGGQSHAPMLRFSGWRLDIVRRELRSSDHTLTPLSGAEFELLVVFAQHPRRVLTREQLIDLSRGPRHEAFDRSIDVQVSRLRRKIEEDPGDPEIIRTVRNVGYMFNATVERT
jgi:two-component system OmpR family response regulator